MVVLNDYPNDVRVHREAVNLAKKNRIFVFCYRNRTEKKFEKLSKNILINRVFNDRFKNNRSSIGYVFSQIFSTIEFFLVLLKDKNIKYYDIIHVHNPPDILVLPALFFKIFFGFSVILDRHEPFASSVVSLINKTENSFIFSFLSSMETIMSRMVDGLIVINNLENNYFKNRGIGNIVVVRNSFNFKELDYNLLQSTSTLSRSNLGFNDEDIVLLYQGFMGKRRDLDTLIRLFENLPDSRYRLLLLGDGPLLNEISEYVKEKKMSKLIKIHNSVPVKDVQKFIAIADICLVLAKNIPVYKHYTPNKLFEYLALRKPTIVPLLTNIVYLTRSKLPYYEPGSYKSLAGAIKTILTQDQDEISKSIEYVLNLNKWEDDEQRINEFYHKIPIKGN